MTLNHVSGKDSGKVVLYALSTCPWCGKAKKLLDDLGVEYYFTDVDRLAGKERSDLLDTIRKWNPACSFPTIVFNNKTCIVGFRENEIREALKA